MPQALRFTLLSVPALLAIACAQPQPSDDVAARVGSTPITMDQVDAQVRKAEPETWQSLFDTRQRSLDYLIDEQLLSDEAGRQGIDIDSLVAREVSASVPTVSDEDVQAFLRTERTAHGRRITGSDAGTHP